MGSLTRYFCIYCFDTESPIEPDGATLGDCVYDTDGAIEAQRTVSVRRGLAVADRRIPRKRNRAYVLHIKDIVVVVGVAVSVSPVISVVSLLAPVESLVSDGRVVVYIMFEGRGASVACR